MRYGFTTGSCAAAASKAAAWMLLTGTRKTEITIETPKKILYTAEILNVTRGEREVSCAVRKDGGDDPDVTTGARIFASVSLVDSGNGEIHIVGGPGVGRVTKPGLDQPVGEAAINRVPREMIEKELREVMQICDYRGGLRVEISVPDGEHLAEQTFNPRLGIYGGISILGTTGIVEPMSSQALLDTIRAELTQRRALGYDYVVISPGNYGQDYLKAVYGYDLDKSVKCSNFIGQTIDMAAELGFRKLLLAGHVGKLIKVAGGIMNTHSREGDCRMELLAAFAVRAKAAPETALRILNCAVTEEAVQILKENGICGPVMDYAMERICFYLNRRAGGTPVVDCIMYAGEFGTLAKSEGVEEWFTLLEREQEPPI